ncbi:hypothetical protein D3C87_721070 [compost metagenome]
MGVKVSETRHETRMATATVMANSLKSRPTIPPMKSTGMKTAASEMVIAMIVKTISREPSRAASRRLLPCSMWRTMFSSMTIASSTTRPVARVSAISERLFKLKPMNDITPKVARIDTGSAKAGIKVADRFLRKRKMTMMTSPIVSTSVNWTSLTDSRMEVLRS